MDILIVIALLAWVFISSANKKKARKQQEEKNRRAVQKSTARRLITLHKVQLIITRASKIAFCACCNSLQKASLVMPFAPQFAAHAAFTER